MFEPKSLLVTLACLCILLPEVRLLKLLHMHQVLLCFGAHMEMGGTENLTSAVNAESHEDDIKNCSQNALES